MPEQGQNDPAGNNDSRLINPKSQHSNLTDLAQKFPLSGTVKQLLMSAYVAQDRKVPTLTIASFLHSAAIHGGGDSGQDVSTNLFGAAARSNRFGKLIDVGSTRAGYRPSVAISPALLIAIEYANEIRQRVRRTTTQVRRRFVVLAILTGRQPYVIEELDEVLLATDVGRRNAARDIVQYCASRVDENDNTSEWNRLFEEWGFPRFRLKQRESESTARAQNNSDPSPPVDVSGASDAPEASVARSTSGVGTPSLIQMPPTPTPSQKPTPPPKDSEATSDDQSPSPTLYTGIPLCDSDDPWAQNLVDRSGADREARAFARMILSPDFKPPLAVGVFGDWGSGKSFFMRMVHKEIEPSEKAGPGAHHLTKIVQIRFNAWHYAETNLWASLVDHIFRELDAWADRQNTHNLADQLFEQLATARQLTFESAERLIERRRERDAAAKKLKIAQTNLEKERVYIENKMDTFATTAWTTIFNELKPDIDNHAKNLGIDETIKSATDLRSTVSEFNSLVSQSTLYRANMLRALGRWTTIASFLAATVMAPVAIEAVASCLKINLAPATAAVSGITFALAGALSLTNRSVARAMAFFQKLNERYDKAVSDKLVTEHADVLNAKAEFKKKEVEANEASDLLDATNTRVNQAISDYNTKTGRGRVLRFVRERVTAGDYAKQLGFVATVRKDFEELDFLMRGQTSASTDTKEGREAFKSKVDRLVDDSKEYLTDSEKSKLQEMTKENTSVEKSFDRMVLYVDDLDRCPPEKVIEVLQAVHLLLTFPLFVVFVAVDVRWLRKALTRHYGGQLTRRRSSSSAAAGDYLEKIFQIPYWVRLIDVDGTRSILRDRLGPASPKPSNKKIEPSHSEPDEQIEDDVASSAESIATNGGSGDAPAFHAASTDNAPEVKPLEFTENESAYIEKVAAILDGSPRRTLRFINTYRVLKASLPEADIERVEQGDYSGLLSLLAVSIGADDAYHVMVHGIEEAIKANQPAGARLEMLSGIKESDMKRIQRAYRLCVGENGRADSLATYAGLVQRYMFGCRDR